ncbi:hypothetical protein [Streptomyces hydrogenans]|uniref:Uncharacterized protein n=1 Tax=Streptomyces hydrogenans TaxID=1873719 RepID=A0ABQ3PJK7_9ACTN|nr:hypothetical protein [Streptomyces hydrogenans]GHG10035.1 hypothetical protein GCM10018784_23380 [Streptomyces hydrogenans]GHI25210.1 hypothetical protein Shyd_65810 [Streptomyces hydrogenans]
MTNDDDPDRPCGPCWRDGSDHADVHCQCTDTAPCCQDPDGCCGCTCPPQEDDEDERRVMWDCGVHGDDGCIAADLIDPGDGSN